ncbi:hypothetical protein NOCARDAX2BIS_480010 [Nocardioides sp. AX2bis]|nr:hypothetical protein NOCARDAX2BIS_480010 [Nocardioides sp. AX2bis]
MIMMRIHPPAEASLSVFVESPRIPIIDQGPPAPPDKVKGTTGRTGHPPLARHTCSTDE